MEDSKSAATPSETSRRDESARDDPLDALRHNGTYTIPPGMRAAWLSKPLPRLTAEHLQATDELDPGDLVPPNRALESKPRLPPLIKRNLVLSVVAFGLVLGMGLGLVMRRPNHPNPSHLKGSGDATLSSAALPGSGSEVTPSNARVVTPTPDPIPPVAIDATETGRAAAVASVPRATIRPNAKAPIRAAEVKGAGTTRSVTKRTNHSASDDADVGLFKPE